MDWDAFWKGMEPQHRRVTFIPKAHGDNLCLDLSALTKEWVRLP